ncbi:unnamed protein product [Haemonchus placei]|uniref:Uncharacterized protein n=1 Tax=Haemonchus placei TaxID=6290 RepID=A0A3P8CMF3_HAEPC|nr:unnamed protein product [Haemonchus placei]
MAHRKRTNWSSNGLQLRRTPRMLRLLSRRFHPIRFSRSPCRYLPRRYQTVDKCVDSRCIVNNERCHWPDLQLYTHLHRMMLHFFFENAISLWNR